VENCGAKTNKTTIELNGYGELGSVEVNRSPASNDYVKTLRYPATRYLGGSMARERISALHIKLPFSCLGRRRAGG
jgi:hypothetical protein